MTRTTDPARPGACPPRDELAAFNRGELPDADLERLAQHLSGCRPCASTLEGLRAEDTLGAGLRAAFRGPPEEEPGLDELEARARALAPDLARTPGDPSAVTETERPAEAEPPLPRPFGPYELLERLGHGGMGVVYKARQTALNRLVALKRLHAGPYAGPEERARFRTEAEAIARLRHPNVVQVYEVGEYEGQLYLSMELVEGGSLARRLADGPLPQREAAELVRALACAVQAVHARQIVHRDLKPGNVLLDADGTAKVSDFGLAKLLDTEAGHTRTGAVMGTPAYMAPEQAEGRSREVGPATDVYALGAILYQALTGRPPFPGGARSAILEQVRGQEPVPPRGLRPDLSGELEAVCLKCLEKEPQKRYASAEALAEELGRWLRGEPTEVRPQGRARRVLRWLRRRPRRVAAALGVLLTLVLALLWWPKDADKPVQGIEARLARGEEVTLIGPTGGPTWYRWSEGGQEATVAAARDGTFAVHSSSSLALVELVRNPPRPPYRLRAWVRHDKSGLQGMVGLYVAHHLYDSPGGTVHHFGALMFNDLLGPSGKGKERLNPVVLGLQLYARGGERPWEPRFGGASSPFKPTGLSGGRWREVAVKVTADGLEGFWAGQTVGKAPAARWKEEAEKYLAFCRKAQPEGLCAFGYQPDFAPAGGLGLYVYESSASFHSVVVEPLNGGD